MDLRKQNDLVEAVSLAINNTESHPERQQQLETFGFGAPQFTSGKNLLKEFTQKQATQAQLQNEQWALSQQINASLEAMQMQFKEHVRIVQVALRQDAALLHSLRIERVASRRWDCVRQAVYFYGQLQQQNVNLETYGITAKEVQQALKAAQELLQRKEARADKKSLAENSTEEKRKAQAALYQWVVDFRTIARMAFRNQPQTLEAFGIRVRAKV